jgi:cytoskeletal protein CcmA (bactofilin family)
VDELVVAGHLEGEVHARRRVELLETARVVGTLRSPALAVAEGGILEGRCERVTEAESS